LFERALAEGNAADANLSSYIQSLSEEVGVPLEVKRFGSGGNVIVAVRESELVANLLKRLGSNPNVESVQIASQEGRPPSTIEVKFKEDTPEAKEVARAAKIPTESSAEIRAITEKLEQSCRVPLTARAMFPNRLLVIPDPQRMTLDLAARLAKLADVEYAQPNFIRRPMTSEVQPK
jgi:hypothetical protein